MRKTAPATNRNAAIEKLIGNRTEASNTLTRNISFSFGQNASHGWQEQARDFAITTTGRAFLQVISQSTAPSTWYFTQVEFFRRNGAQLVVDGSIVTELVNDQAITDTLYTEVLSSPSNDIEGDNSWHEGVSGTVAFDLPYGYDGWLVVKALFGQDFPANSGWDSYIEVTGPSPYIPGGSVTGPSYGAAFAQATSNCFIAIPVIGTGSPVTITAKLWWKGTDSNVVLKSRQLEAYIRKR